MAKKVCIDAGHYGKYNRAPGVPTYYESEAMWKLHLKLKAALEAYGIQVIATRTKQSMDRELYARGYAAKGCDLFVSLHSNAVGSKVNNSVDYVRVYHLTEDTTTKVDDISKAVAQKIAPAVAKTMGTKQKWEALSRLASSDKNGDGMKNDNYYGVLNGARQAGVPGILVEHSFHTNNAMAQWLLSDANLDKLAQAEAEVIADYFGVEKPAQDPTSDYTMEFKYLRIGSKGEAVKAVQGLLIAEGYNCGPTGADGNLGINTRAALIHYQTERSLAGDGVVGPATMGSLLGIK